jgi:hypothetical protein
MLTATLTTNRTQLGTLAIQRIETHPTGSHRYRATRYDALGRKVAEVEFHHDPHDGADVCVRDALTAIERCKA